MKRDKHNSIIFIIFIWTFFISYFNSDAQVKFQKEFAITNLYETKQTPDSGYISVGWWNDILSSNQQYACLIKTNSFGDTTWTRMYGQSNNVIAFSTERTTDGGYILCGFTYDGKVYLVKTDVNGDTLWSKKLGESGTSIDYGRRVHQTFDGGFIITGWTGNFDSGIYVIKTDSVGDVEWSRVFKGVKDDKSYSICQTADSGYVALGVLSAFQVNGDIVLIKMNSLGDTLWTKSYGGPGQDYAFCIQQTYNHGFAIAGYTQSFSSGGDALLLITDSIGNLLWLKSYGGTGTGYIHGFYVTQTADSGYILSGHTNSFGVATKAPFVMKVDSVGDIIWSKTYDDLDGGVAWSIVQTFDGGYVTAGEQNEIMKLDSNGISGCFENIVSPVITNLPITLVSNPITVTSVNTLNFPDTTIMKKGIDFVNICTSVGINEVSIIYNYPKVYPNPASEKFTISFAEKIDYGVLIFYNLLGEKILEENISQSSHKEINLQNISSGIYFTKVFDGKNIYCNKLIVERN